MNVGLDISGKSANKQCLLITTIEKITNKTAVYDTYLINSSSNLYLFILENNNLLLTTINYGTSTTNAFEFLYKNNLINK